MFEKVFHTEIEIDAEAERVWEVLTDFSSYQEWNPMIKRASGELRVGARLQLHFEPAGRKGHDFRPKLLVVEANRELRWLGQPGFPKLFESEHTFILEPKGDGTIHLDHDFIAYGLLTPLARKRVEASVIGPFEDMNRALKERSEK